MKKVIMLSLLVLSGLTVVGCSGDSGLTKRIDELEDKIAVLENGSGSVESSNKIDELEGKISGLEDKIAALEKNGFYATKNQFTFSEEVTIYHNQKKLYSLKNFGSPGISSSSNTLSFSFTIVAYDNYIVPASIFGSFFLEWNGGIKFHTSDTTYAYYTTGFKNNSQASYGIRWDVSDVLTSVKSSSYHNFLIAIPGTTIPITKVTIPLVL